MSYFACIIIRDGERTIGKTISSLLNQSVPPRKIIVVNDGSNDSTGTIIETYKKSSPDLIEIINTDNTTRDHTRLPRLRTQAIEYGQAHGCGDCEYFMTTGGDCNFEPAYAEKILSAMENEPSLVIASGDYGSMSSVSPHGAGRFVRASFFSDYSKNYPLRAWQESELKMRAICSGYKTAVIKVAVFEHLDKLGHSHNFVGWGRVMKALGYSRLYVWGRFAKGILLPGRIGRKSALRMLWTYLTYRPPNSGYYSICEPELRKAVAEMQRKMIIRMLKHRLRRRIMKAVAPNAKAFYAAEMMANDRVLPMNEELYREILSYKTASVFEFGCGQGKNLNMLSKKVSIVAGIDISKAAIQWAKESLGLTLVQVGDEHTLSSIESGRFDVVFTSSVLDHIEDINEIIKQLKRIARKAIIALETNDKVGKFYYPHDYESYGFIKTGYSYPVVKSYGKTAIYHIWRWEKC